MLDELSFLFLYIYICIKKKARSEGVGRRTVLVPTDQGQCQRLGCPCAWPGAFLGQATPGPPSPGCMQIPLQLSCCSPQAPWTDPRTVMKRCTTCTGTDTLGALTAQKPKPSSSKLLQLGESSNCPLLSTQHLQFPFPVQKINIKPLWCGGDVTRRAEEGILISGCPLYCFGVRGSSLFNCLVIWSFCAPSFSVSTFISKLISQLARERRDKRKKKFKTFKFRLTFPIQKDASSKQVLGSWCETSRSWKYTAQTQPAPWTLQNPVAALLPRLALKNIDKSLLCSCLHCATLWQQGCSHWAWVPCSFPWAPTLTRHHF